MWEFVEKVVYINLAKRPDRNEHMKEMTKPFGNKVLRFEAIEAEPGSIGCARSHIGVLELAIQEGWKNVLVLEDDAEWNEFDTNYKRLEKLVSQPFDVILLGGVAVHKDSTEKVYSSQTASSYLVQTHYYSTLLNNFKEACSGLSSGDHRTYAIDQYWKRLQKVDTWYIVSNPCMIYQKPDYSDIEKYNVDYREAFQI
jgi:glycosyl transferase family 25